VFCASVYGLALSRTITAVVALAAGLAVAAALLARWGRRPRRAVLVGTAAAGVLAVALLVAFPLGPRLGRKLADLRSGQVNQLLTGRLDGWRAAGWMFARHPVLGVGHGAYGAEFGDAKLALLARGTPFYPAHVYPSFGNAHNEVLEVAAEWGALGLAALAWGLWQVVRAVRRLGSPVAGGDAAAARRRAALAWSLLAALAVLSMAHFPFRLALTAFPALLLLAWIFAAGRPPAAAAEREGIAGRTLAWVLVPVLLVAVVAQGDRLRDRLRSGRILKTVEAVTVAVAAGGAPPPTLLWTHVRLLEEAAALAPADSGVPLAQGSQYLLLGRLPEAQQAYRRSLALSSRPEGWLNLGRAQWQAGERQAALDSFARATALNPRLAREVPRAAARELVRRR
jgi:tetratricopeptide (TPR) repeat protein